MRKVEYWLWIVDSETPPGKRIKTRYRMTEADALARDPTSVKVPGSCEIREIPETDEEFARANFHSINAGPPRKP
jgi:hypothetical protein